MYEELLAHVPGVITKDIGEYVTNDLFKSSRYIFKYRDGKKLKGYCTGCKSDFPFEGAKHNEEYICPCCNKGATVKDSGRGRGSLIDEACFVYFKKSLINPNVIVGIGCFVFRDYSIDYRTVENKYCVKALYLFDADSRKTTMLKRDLWAYSDSYTDSHGWSKTSSVYNFNINSLNNLPFGVCRKSLEDSIKDTPFKYLPTENFKSYHIVQLLELYLKYPNIEKLIKIGVREILEERFFKISLGNAINWRGKDVYKILKLKRKDVKELTKFNLDLSAKELKFIQDIRTKDDKLSVQGILELGKDSYYSTSRFETLLEHTDYSRIHSYYQKQKALNKIKNNIISTWRDYIEDCKKLDYNLKDKKVLFPKDLYSAHQRTIALVKLKVDTELDMKIRARYKELSKYVLINEQLIIRPIRNMAEIIEEGKVLKHCVGTYSKKHAEGETIILVIRKRGKLGVPFYTVEINEKNGTVIQIRGLRNCAPTKDVKEFMDVFKEAKLTKKKNRLRVPA